MSPKQSVIWMTLLFTKSWAVIPLTDFPLKFLPFPKNYLATSDRLDIAMGTRMAPSYANLFMEDLESQLLNSVERRPLVWWRYIDDVFAIWTFSEEHLVWFVEEIHHYHSTIKFMAKWFWESVSFLDVKVILRGGQIATDLYTKPTDTPVSSPMEQSSGSL